MSKRRHRIDDREKREELALVIPLFGLILLMPLLVNLFAGRGLFLGIPLEIVYLFSVWLLLVSCAAALSYLLPRTGPFTGKGDEEEP